MRSMQPVSLGRSGLKVSPMCLGTMTFADTTDLEVARQIADLCLARGVFFWDTADAYSTGASEAMVGKLMAGRRQEIVLATKVFAAMGPGANDRGLSARHIHHACEASLKRLGTDWIDLYYLHVPDRSVPTQESLRALEDLARSGKVRYLACSNYRAWEVLDMLNLAQNSGWQPISAIQPLYNLVNRDIEVELLPMARAKGLGVVSYSPLARGILTGKYKWNAQNEKNNRLARADKRFMQAEWREESVRAAAELVKLSQGRGCTAGQLAIAWAMANENIDSVILGARTLEQAQQALDAEKVEWDVELESACDTLIPPGCHSGKAFFDERYPITGRSI